MKRKHASGYIIIAVIGILLILGSFMAYMMHVFSDMHGFINASVQYHRVKEAAYSSLALAEVMLHEGSCKETTLELTPKLKLDDIHTHIACQLLDNGKEYHLTSQAELHLNAYPYLIRVFATKKVKLPLKQN